MLHYTRLEKLTRDNFLANWAHLNVTKFLNGVNTAHILTPHLNRSNKLERLSLARLYTMFKETVVY
jgi:hypothetical protein